ncbi:hypothetical protein BY458DRAFT_498900 [Sporodiniella umbellata]|nr:hypothetical protein BY458DRAFT_498900 [Sporodiniella umbellata]
MLELFFIVPYFFGKAMENEKRKQIERQIMEEYLQKKKEMEEAAQRAQEEAARKAREEDLEAMVDQEIDEEGWVIEKESGYIIGQVVEGDLAGLIGKKVGQNGIISDENGNTIGRVEPVEESSEEEEEEEEGGKDEEKEGDEEERRKDEKKEETNEEEKQTGFSPSNTKELEEHHLKPIQAAIEITKKTLDRVTPVLKTISWTIGCEERKAKKERNKLALMNHIKLLIEQASVVLSEAYQTLPAHDENVAYQASAKSLYSELADVLSLLVCIVVKTICRVHKKTRGMTSIKSQIDNQLGLIQNPLLNIMASVIALSTEMPLLLEARLNTADAKEQGEVFYMGKDEKETVNGWLDTLTKKEASLPEI